jgi:hypothetical protein
MEGPTVSTLTRAQRNAVVYALGHLIRGMDPDDDHVMLRPLHGPLTPELEHAFREQLRIWAGSWIAPALAALLADADGKPLRPGDELSSYTDYMHFVDPEEVDRYVDQYVKATTEWRTGR